jgi:putative transcriptional regulator
MASLATLLLVLAAMVLPCGAAAAAEGPVVAESAPALTEPAGQRPGPGKFLVARRSLTDPNFRETVVYLVAHDEEGTWGMVVNRRTEMRLSEVLPEIYRETADRHRLFVGGPVALSNVVLLFRQPVEEGLVQEVTDGVYVSLDRDVLDHLLAEDTPAESMRLFAGHAGWSPGQLAAEIDQDAWYVVPGDLDALFSRNVVFLWHRLIAELEPSGVEVKQRRRRAVDHLAAR